MRRHFLLVTVLTLAACGGGSSVSGSPGPAATSPPGGISPQRVTPTFKLKITPRHVPAGTKRPGFVSSGTLSVSIGLTLVNGTSPGTLPGNPALTNVPIDACSAGCTVNGPPSPVGTDTFVVTTFDAANAGGHALDTKTATFAILEAAANSETITLDGIPATITIGALGFPAGVIDALKGRNVEVAEPGDSTPLDSANVVVADADGEAIAGTYSQPVTLSDPDTNGDGTYLEAATCPAYPTGNTTAAATSAVFTGSTSTAIFCYGGLAENPVTLTAAASGATSGTVIFSPTLHTPLYIVGSGSPAPVVVGNSPPDIELSTASGTGSTATVMYQENGWTNAPYDQTLIATAGVCSIGGPLSTYATVSASTPEAGFGTMFTESAASPWTPGVCSSGISDGRTLNASDLPATLDSSYTSSGWIIDGRRHRTH